MTFKVIVTYQVHNGTIMTKELTGIEKVERAREENGDNIVEVVRVYERPFTWVTWLASAILNINMIVER